MPCVTRRCIPPPCVLGNSLGLPSDTLREGRQEVPQTTLQRKAGPTNQLSPLGCRALGKSLA